MAGNTVTQPSKHCLRDHVAVRLMDCIVVVSSNVPEIWSYNLWTEKWRKCTVFKEEQIPPTKHQCGVVIQSNIYLFGGCDYDDMLWKLTRSPDGSFEWNIIDIGDHKKSPSVRYGHCGWEYGSKMWIFGGFGFSPVDFLNDHGDFTVGSVSRYINFGWNNQLICFDPSIQTWQSLKCFGDVPSPRAFASVARIMDTVWLYGGTTAMRRYNAFAARTAPFADELFQLNMSTLAWTRIETSTPKPEAIGAGLTPITEKQLVLYGGSVESVQILDVGSYTWKKHSAVQRGIGSRLHYRTGITGLKSNVTIIGVFPVATRSRKLSRKQSSSLSRSVMLEPKSLLQLAIKIISENKNELPWKCLPESFRCKMMDTETE